MKILYRTLRLKIKLINPPATQCPSYAGIKLIEHHIIFMQANSFNSFNPLTLKTFQKRLRLVVFQLTVCESTYCTVVSILCSGARAYVPKCHKGFLILVGRAIGHTKGGVRRIRQSMEGSG